MKIFETALSWERNHQELKDKKQSLGFVPTMGALHEGHLSLMKMSLEQNDKTIVSIFVNPTQFDNPNDLKHYPKTLEEDILKMKSIGVDYVFLPSVKEIYPEQTISQTFEFDGIDQQMEGKHRVGHFDGVATVVSRFFELIKPDRAYFGEKDFQQLRIIQELTELKNYAIEIISAPIFREKDGLAMSSRNMRLTGVQRQEAAQIFKLLSNIKNDSINEINSIRQYALTFLEPFKNLRLEYLELADEQSLKPLDSVKENQKCRLFIAVFAGEVRLIDNIAIN